MKRRSGDLQSAIRIGGAAPQPLVAALSCGWACAEGELPELRAATVDHDAVPPVQILLRRLPLLRSTHIHDHYTTSVTSLGNCGHLCHRSLPSGAAAITMETDHQFGFPFYSAHLNGWFTKGF